MGKGTMMNHFYPPSDESDKLFNRFLVQDWLRRLPLCMGTAMVGSREAAVSSAAEGLSRKLRDCVLALMKLKVRRTVDATGARKMVLKIVNISCHVLQAGK